MVPEIIQIEGETFVKVSPSSKGFSGLVKPTREGLKIIKRVIASAKDSPSAIISKGKK